MGCTSCMMMQTVAGISAGMPAEVQEAHTHPAAGEPVMCADCGHVFVATGHGFELREPSPDELAELKAENPQITQRLRRMKANQN